jgi:hypothetical protein
MDSNDCKIVKFADDTVILSLIQNNDETCYRNTISYVNNWCKNNYLDLNVRKTKDMIFDFRRNRPHTTNVRIDNSDVETVKTYKYLGVHIESNMKWDTHINVQIKKAGRRLYHLRCLRKLCVQMSLMCMCYNSLVSSVLLYAASAWFERCCECLRKEVHKVRKKAGRIIGDKSCRDLIDPASAHKDKCISIAKKILRDPTHPLHHHFHLLPHGLRYQVPRCRTERYRTTFVPTSIRLLNNFE